MRSTFDIVLSHVFHMRIARIRARVDTVIAMCVTSDPRTRLPGPPHTPARILAIAREIHDPDFWARTRLPMADYLLDIGLLGRVDHRLLRAAETETTR